MNHGIYSLKKLLTDQHLEQIIIPEIQRDYVWTVDNVKGLLLSIETDYNKQKANTKNFDESTLDSMAPEFREIVMRSFLEKKIFSNIGFIYAYSGEGDVSSKYFLIDGQQRITTMYLLLLAISIKNKKQTIFRNTYFNHQITKVDYKVREAAHDFLVEFVEFLLEGGDIKQVVEQSWYYTLYVSDKTIQSLIANYKVIQDFVNQSDMDLSFIEDNIELFYFDTSKSEQGEELYIYMNSRGESVQSNENIKAQLLEGLSEIEKHEKGKLWEEWQNFFWLGKDKEVENADEGFDEFLRWIEIIGSITNNPSLTQKEQSDFVRNINGMSKIPMNYITLDGIEHYFKALVRLCGNDIKYFDKNWVSGDIDLIDYVLILPALQYVEKYPDATSVDINRFMRFFYNIIRSDDVAKNPTIYAPQCIQLTFDFLTANLTDIVEIGQFRSMGKYINILTYEEIFKFKMYKNPPTETTREEVEKEFWTIEDFSITNGKILFILECMEVDVKLNQHPSFELEKFYRFSLHFRNLFTNPSDQLRRALLTFGNYPIWDGYSPSLEMHRYNFGHELKHWREIIINEKTKVAVSKFIRQFESDNELSPDQYAERLEKNIEDCKELGTVTDWRLVFINSSKSLSFCEAKRACIYGNLVALLQSIKVTSPSSYRFEKIDLEIVEE